MLANKTGATRWVARFSIILVLGKGASHRLARTHKTVTRWQKRFEAVAPRITADCLRAALPCGQIAAYGIIQG